MFVDIDFCFYFFSMTSIFTKVFNFFQAFLESWQFVAFDKMGLQRARFPGRHRDFSKAQALLESLSLP